MDAAFVIVVAIALCLLSGGIGARLTVAGARPRRVAIAIAELWVLVAVWMAAFHLLAQRGDISLSGGIRGEVGDLLSGLRVVPGTLRVWIVAGLTLCLLLAVHLMWSLSHAKCDGVDS